jgi:Transposase DDE domain
MEALEPLKDKDVRCLGHLRKVFDLLDGLSRVGCERDRAGNRRLFFNVYCKLVLLYVWNPLIDSVRALQQAAQLATVSRALGVGHFSLGSFSESVRAFEPEQLKPVIEELAGQVRPPATDPRLATVEHALTLVDGTVLTGLTRLTRSACGADGRYNTSRDGKAVYGWRLHTQLDLQTFSPHRIDRTGARNAGDNREGNVLRRTLEKGRCYVGDGGFADQSLFDDVTEVQSSFVIRIREDSVLDVTEERLLSQEALDAGVVRDAVVKLPQAVHPVRVVAVQVEPHPRRTRRDPKKQSDLILLATSLLDLPAELVALIYLYRYTVELFFRTFKQLLGMRHLLSQREEGIDVQVYCTVIVCLLICLITGKRPDKATRNMIGWFLIGLATEQELLDHLNKPDHTGAKKRAKDELWKKLGY